MKLPEIKFPIQFAKPSGSMIDFSDSINFGGNCAIVAVGGISLALISNCALKALGFKGVAVTIATAVPATIGAFALGGALLTVGAFACFVYNFRLNL